MINLTKGGVINLTKTNPSLTSFCVGANWGKAGGKPARTEVKKVGGFLGFGGKEEEVQVPGSPGHIAVDLDLSLAVYSEKGERLAKVFYGNKNAKGIKHSGDDLTGDDEDDGLDNETITIDLTKVDSKAKTIVFVLNSFNTGQDFHATPYSGIRLYKGTPDRVEDVVAEFKVDSDPAYAGKRSLILGKLVKVNNEWEFKAIGDITNDTSLSNTLTTVEKKYL